MKLSIPHRSNQKLQRRAVPRLGERAPDPDAHRLLSRSELEEAEKAPVLIRIAVSVPGHAARIIRTLWKTIHETTSYITRHVMRLPLRQRVIIVGASLLVLLLVGAWGVFVIRHSLTQSSTSSPSPQNGTKIPPGKGPKKATPTFDTLTPSGTTSSQNWSLVSPPGRDPVYAYTDKIGGVSVIISQQPLPLTFRAKPEEHVRGLATNYAATDTLDINGLTVYTGISSNGPQSIIFTKGDLLILIKADSTVPDNALRSYISKLR